MDRDEEQSFRPGDDGAGGGGDVQRRAHSLNLHRATLLDAIDNVFIEDPLSEYFRNDRVVVETTSEPETLFESYVKGTCFFSLVCPCFIPHQLIMCSPCSLPLVRKLVQGSS